MFYFLLKSYGGPTKANYQHACIVFAEGLQKLNIAYSANIDYYPDISGTYLFKYSDIPKDTIYIVTAHPEDFKDLLLSLNNYKLIIFDSKDEWVRPQSTSLLHYAYRYFMTTSKIISDRIKPLCFAASNRMVMTIQAQIQIPWLERDSQIFWAHRVDNHYLRNIVKSSYAKQNQPVYVFLDKFQEPDINDIHYWNHTGRRHSSKYFQELQKYKYMDAHGGYLNKDGSIVQWDSWKVWEGLLSGMVVITADLDYYNIKLPFKLVPWTHYIPVRYTHIPDAYANLSRLSEEKKAEIAIAGQKLALEYFTPKSIAKYIMDNL